MAFPYWALLLQKDQTASFGFVGRSRRNGAGEVLAGGRDATEQSFFWRGQVSRPAPAEPAGENARTRRGSAPAPPASKEEKKCNSEGEAPCLAASSAAARTTASLHSGPAWADGTHYTEQTDLICWRHVGKPVPAAQNDLLQGRKAPGMVAFLARHVFVPFNLPLLW